MDINGGRTGVDTCGSHAPRPIAHHWNSKVKPAEQKNSEPVIVQFQVSLYGFSSIWSNVISLIIIGIAASMAMIPVFKTMLDAAV